MEPLTPEAAAALDLSGQDAPVRVLVVDDEETVADLCREFLSAKGYDLTVALSGEEAVRVLPALRPDVILTDINLPGLSGLEVMRYAKSVDPEVGVIVVTGYASASTAIDALRQGAYDYVPKPFDLDDLEQIVDRAVAHRRLRAINRQLVEELRQKNEILQHHEHELRERVRLATWQMTALYDVSKAIMADLELSPRLAMVCEKGAELSGASSAVVYLRVEDSDEFRVAAARGATMAHREDGSPALLATTGPLWAAITHQKPQRHLTAVGDSALEVPGIESGRASTLLGVPLLAEGRVIGVLALLDKPGGFSDDDESFMMLYASQAALAVLNSQLFEHTKVLDRLKSDFVAVVSHEIRTPLTSVKGAIELLSDDRYFQNGEQQTKLLTIAHANAERLLVLINDILDFSKLESASLPMSIERQRLEPVVQQAAHNLRTLIEERRIHLDLLLPDELPELMMDANRVAQVLTNLLSNAIKFSPVSGRIEIQAERWEEGVRIGVRDHGEGIAPQDLGKLFRKFSQIDSTATRKAGGTGLGLVISKGIVEQHGGRIWVESMPGVGSTFFFTLPAAGHVLQPSANA
jgi:signal transduction histidine kinase/DNA-binding response OmpR family regulator